MAENNLLPINKKDDDSNGAISPIDYSASNALLTNSIQKQYPQLNDNEVGVLGNAVLHEVSRRIEDGEKLAFFSKDSDGNTTLSLIGFEVIDNKQPPQNLLGDAGKKSNG